MTTALNVVSEEIVRALRGVELFESLASRDLERVAEAGELEELGRGALLFRGGDPPDRVHLILTGAIEIVRTTPDNPEPVPVAYITPGEIVGDMALFTNSVRRSDGRVPERARVWTLSRARFEAMVLSIEGYGFALARMFANRLEGFITHMRRQARRKELAGRLQYFDLPTVVQTLVTSNQTGILTILDSGGDAVAEVLLRDGAVERARCGESEGEEAFYEIFQRGDEGEFAFRTLADPDPEAISAVAITLPAMKLLIEAMRQVDERRRV